MLNGREGEELLCDEAEGGGRLGFEDGEGNASDLRESHEQRRKLRGRQVKRLHQFLKRESIITQKKEEKKRKGEVKATRAIYERAMSREGN